MAIADAHRNHRAWRLCPFWQSATVSSSSSSTQHLHNQPQSHNYQNGAAASKTRSFSTVSSVARLLFPARRRLCLDPSNNLYFPYEPGKQARSAVRFKNSSKSHVAFKFVEHPENNEKPINQKSKVKFKIMSLKMKQGSDYIPELFDEQREQVTVERILCVVFLDPESSNPALEKLQCQLAEADAALEAIKKKPSADAGPQVNDEGLVLDERKERREKYLARQQVEVVDSM